VAVGHTDSWVAGIAEWVVGHTVSVVGHTVFVVDIGTEWWVGHS
jgi:hypothetical protein